MNTVFRPNFLRALCALILTGLATIVPANATLLVYEGFNGYSTGALAGQKPNGSTVGLDTTVGYYDDAGNRTSGYTIQSGGLTLGSLQTSSGALSYTAGTNVIGADINIGVSPFTGTLWTSYLVKLSSQGGGTGDGSLFRIGDSPADNADIRYTSWSDSRSNSTAVATSYSSTTGNNGSASLDLNTTYIIIASFTRVGANLSAGSPGVATLWALNSTQFANFLTNGGNEAALAGTSVTATATHSTTSGTLTFVTGDATSFVTVNGTGVFDELRIGSALADVTPTAIPEPAATTALVGLAAALCTVRRKRRA
jgi:hypothetical protein